MSALVSVVIATRDRAEQLRGCLHALRGSLPPPGWSVEVIVVDNGSTDATAGVVASERAAGVLGVRYLVESRRGKAYAVNTGTAAAAGALIAFLDDDVVPEAGWLYHAVAPFDRDPGLGLLAGRVVGPGSGGGPATTQANEETPLDPDRSLQGLVLGCNLAVRPEVIAAVRGRDTRLGPGRGFAYEDIDFVYRVLRRGVRGLFSPLPIVVHHPGDRNRSVEYLRGRGAYYAKFIVQGDRTVTRQAWWELTGLWHDFRRGLVRPAGRAPTRAWHLGVGALRMTARMLASSVRIGEDRRG